MCAASAFRTTADNLTDGIRAATGCITRQLPSVTPNPFFAYPAHTISLGQPGKPASLRGPAGPTGLHFDFRLDYQSGDGSDEIKSQSGSVHVAAYEYRLLDHDHRELLVYHWQPGSRFSGPDHPHLHISASLAAQVTTTTRRAIRLDKLHLTTERVTLAAFVRMLIEEFGVRPIHRDWRRRLTRADAVLIRWQIGTEE